MQINLNIKQILGRKLVVTFVPLIYTTEHTILFTRSAEETILQNHGRVFLILINVLMKIEGMFSNFHTSFLYIPSSSVGTFSLGVGRRRGTEKAGYSSVMFSLTVKSI